MAILLTMADLEAEEARKKKERAEQNQKVRRRGR